MQKSTSQPKTRPLPTSLRVTHHSGLSLLRTSDSAKRVFDLLAALAGLAFVSPLLLLISILIRRDSPGPVFYRGERCGRNGKTFCILKFRTMFELHESTQGPRVTAQDDPRVTRLGRWLRASKLNELPQLWNVLVGEMSLVGPRPEDPQIAADWPEGVRSEILSMRPGVTSPASVLYRHEESLLKTEAAMDTYFDAILPGKRRLDQLYVRNHSFLLDLDILFWTILVLMPRLMPGVGGQTPGDRMPEEQSPMESLLFTGPISRFIRRYVSWYVIDTLVILASIAATGAVWRTQGPLPIGPSPALTAACVYALLFSLAGAALGINRTSWTRANASDAFDLIPAIGAATILILLINEYIGRWGLPRLAILATAGLAFFGMLAVRYRTRLISGPLSRWLALRRGAWAARERVLIVGSGESAQFAAWMLQNTPGANTFRVVGYIDDDLKKQGRRIRGIDVLGLCSDIPRLSARYDVGIVIFAIHRISGEERQRILNICKTTRARLFVIPDVLASIRQVTTQLSQPESPAAQVDGERLQGQPDGLSPAQVESWLEELQAKAGSGDLLGLQARIREFQEHLHTSRDPG